MHEQVPKDCKPAVYDHSGNQVTFPKPTKNIPKPRIHWPAPKEAQSVKARDCQVEVCAQGTSSVGDSHAIATAPERRPGRSKRQQPGK